MICSTTTRVGKICRLLLSFCLFSFGFFGLLSSSASAVNLSLPVKLQAYYQGVFSQVTGDNVISANGTRILTPSNKSQRGYAWSIGSTLNSSWIYYASDYLSVDVNVYRPAESAEVADFIIDFSSASFVGGSGNCNLSPVGVEVQDERSFTNISFIMQPHGTCSYPTAIRVASVNNTLISLGSGDVMYLNPVKVWRPADVITDNSDITSSIGNLTNMVNTMRTENNDRLEWINSRLAYIYDALVAGNGSAASSADIKELQNQLSQDNKQQLDAINNQTKQDKEQYDKEKEEEKQREDSANEEGGKLSGIFNITLLNPFAGIWELFNPGGCTSIPTIASWVHSEDTVYCSWWPQSIRATLTPVFSLAAMMLLFGFVARWLGGSGGFSVRVDGLSKGV